MNRLLRIQVGIALPRCLRHLQLVEERGVSLVWLALMLPVLVGFVALVIDVGTLLEVRRQLQTSVDAAALGGAQELPTSPPTAQSVAFDYVDRNYDETLQSVSADVWTTYYGDDTITVTAVRNVPLAFMPVLGIGNSEVAATATAIVGSLGQGDCVLPIGVADTNGTTNPGDPDDIDGWTVNGFGYDWGQEVTLKYGAQGGTTGNYGPLGIYGHGANAFRDAISGQCSGITVQVGDEVDTEPGNMVGPTIQGFEERLDGDSHQFDELVGKIGDTWPYQWYYKESAFHPDGTLCPRLALLPIIPDYIPPGRSDPVLILGFARFYIKEVYQENDTTTNPPTRLSVVVGKFVGPQVQAGEFRQYGPIGPKVVRLIQ